MLTKFDLQETVKYQDRFKTFREGKITKIFIVAEGVQYYINEEVVPEENVFKTQVEFKKAKKEILKQEKIKLEEKLSEIENEINII